MPSDDDQGDDDPDPGTNGGPERDPESGRFVSPSTDSPDRGSDRQSPRDENATDGGVSAPPPRQLTEQEVRAFLRDVLEYASAEEWYGASDGQPSGAPERPGGGRRGGRRGGEGERRGDAPAAVEESVVLTSEGMEALEAEGYAVRDVPPSLGEPPRSVETDSYALVTVDVAEGAEPKPERSVDEILSAVDSGDDDEVADG